MKLKLCFDIAGVGQKKVRGAICVSLDNLHASYSGTSLYECNSYLIHAMVKRSFQPSFTTSMAARLACRFLGSISNVELH